jgi:hypothetical protein
VLLVASATLVCESRSDIREDVTGVLSQDIQEGEAHNVKDLVKFKLHDTQNRRDMKRVLQANHGLDVDEVEDFGVNLLQVFAPKAMSSTFEGMGLNLIEMEYGQPFSVTRQSGSPAYDSYHNRTELMSMFKSLEKQHPKLAHIMDLTKRYKLSKTFKGNHIYAMKISDNVRKSEPEHNVLLVSNHHARELVTPELALSFAQKLLNGYKMDTNIRKVVDDNQIFIIWTLNPDGLDIVWNQNKWNRVNARGVDLNRNYPVGFDLSCGGASYKGSETYRGKKPFSEVETQTMRAFQREFNFAKLLDFHSYSQEVRHGYADCGDLDNRVQSLFQKVSKDLAKKMRYEEADSCCLGGDISYAYNQHGSTPILVETAMDFQPVGHQMQDELKRVWPGVLRFLQMPLPVSGKVTDSSGKPVKDAEIVLPDYKFSFNEKKPVRPDGLFHLWVPPGKLKLQVKHAKGVHEVQVDVDDNGVQHDIQLPAEQQIQI